MNAPSMVSELLTPHQREVMRGVLDDESARREHLVVHLSGAHAYGFPSPDSDLDLKAIHIADTADLVGLDVPTPTVDRAEIIDGVEIDYTSNELGHALAGILGGNGNFIERVLGHTAAQASSLLDELRPIVKRSLSRRVYRHYNGFAHNQLRAVEREPTVKRLLYVLRTTLTGVHLLEVGEVEPDLTRLMDPYAIPEAAELIDRKRAGETVTLPAEAVERWRSTVEALFRRLDEAHAKSPLPEDPANGDEIRAWLLTVRRSRLR